MTAARKQPGWPMVQLHSFNRKVRVMVDLRYVEDIHLDQDGTGFSVTVSLDKEPTISREDYERLNSEIQTLIHEGTGVDSKTEST